MTDSYEKTLISYNTQLYRSLLKKNNQDIIIFNVQNINTRSLLNESNFYIIIINEYNLMYFYNTNNHENFIHSVPVKFL